MGFGRARRRARGICVAVVVVCALGVPAAASATILTVTTTVDNLTPHDGQCTLREAVAAVNAPGTSTDCGTADPHNNTIMLGPHPYTLSIGPDPTDDNTTGDLDLTANAFTTIQGAGVAQTSITGAGFPANNPDRLFHVINGNVSMLDLTLTKGKAPDGLNGEGGTNAVNPAMPGNPGFNGGAIFNGASLGLADVAVTDNVAGNGGKGGAGAPDNNVAPGATGGTAGVGGGIANFGSLELNHVTISGNHAGNGGAGGTGGSNPVGNGANGANGGDGGCCGDGGGVYSGGGGVLIANSTFTLNHAGNGGDGGHGGDGDPSSGTAGSGGSGAGGGSGGAIAVTDGTLKVIDSTFVSNFSGSGGNGHQGGLFGHSGGNGGNAGNGSTGGGLFLRGGTATTGRLLHDVTIADNDVGPPGVPGSAGISGSSGGAPGNAPFGGGVYTVGPAATSMQDTLLASNALGNCAGSNTDSGTNLSFGDVTCPATFATGDPKLGRLKDNGGPTQTSAIGAGGAAQNKGTDCLSPDQRGATLPSTQVCDIGAYELKLPDVSVASPTGITSTGAKLHGSATANNATATVVFEFGKTTAYGERASAPDVSDFTATPVSATLSGLSPGTTYHYRLRATSSDGTTTTTDATFTTGGSGGGGGGGGGGAAPGSPRLTHLSITPRSFFAAPNRHHKTGAAISYTDSAKSRTTFVVFARLGGRKVKGRCTKARRHQRKNCIRLVKVGSFTHSDQRGRNSVHFAGRLRGHKLAPGSYLLEATPRASGKTGRTATATFTIKRVRPVNVRAVAAAVSRLL